MGAGPCHKLVQCFPVFLLVLHEEQPLDPKIHMHIELVQKNLPDLLGIFRSASPKPLSLHPSGSTLLSSVELSANVDSYDDGDLNISSPCGLSIGGPTG